MTTEIKLTAYSHGAGCGCKISPKVLGEILQSEVQFLPDTKLLVGNETRDDAAVYELNADLCLISTTDFFMPIVDDPFEFGRIAATNAISDVYAMGGKPILAIAILGWPINKLSADIAQQVVEGGRSVCRDAGITLAGGHSIDNQEPLFGLAVNGIVTKKNLRQNSTAKAGDILFLTKPLGVGILATAEKKGILKKEHQHLATHYMTMLNKIGMDLGAITKVHALTDVTGFGLLGHLGEMCTGSGLSAEIKFSLVPVIDEAIYYRDLGALPGGTQRNWDSYGSGISAISDSQKAILCDPQTSGGLLVAVDPTAEELVSSLLKDNNLCCQPFGVLTDAAETLIKVL